MSTGDRTSPAHTTRSQRALVASAIGLFAVASVYLALVIITHAIPIFFPGNPVRIPGGSVLQPLVPGIDLTGSSASDAPINILVVGIDRRPYETAWTRTDTIEVVSVNPKTKSANILGIPRDLWVAIPLKSGGYYHDRVNTALVQAESQHYPEGPIGLMKEVLQHNLGIKIDKYVLIDFNGFKKIIDALGGIDVNVPTEVYDPYYSESELPGAYNPQHFYPGIQHMDGETALAYARIRYSSDDLDRIQRQQRVIFAVIAKANSLGVLSKALPLWNEYKSAIRTDIPDSLIPGYAVLAKQVEGNLHAVSLGPATVPCTKAGGAEVLCWSKASVDPIVQAVFANETPAAAASATPPAPVRVQVENGTTTTNLARDIVQYIASKGYPVNQLETTNAFDGTTHSQSIILTMKSGTDANAQLLATWLNIPADRIRSATAAEKAQITGTPDIVVVLGADGNFASLIQSAATSTPGG